MKKIKLTLVLILLPLTTLALAYTGPFGAENAVYKIEIRNGSKLHYGTGILIGKNKILTNCHVVNHEGIFSVTHRRSGQRFSTKNYYNLGNLDACILQGVFPKGEPVRLANSFEIGETVWHFGYPHGVSGYGQGPILGMVQTDNGLVIESGSFCNPGSSGGPLLNVYGELVGLNFGVRSVGAKNKCLSIPVSELKRRL